MDPHSEGIVGKLYVSGRDVEILELREAGVSYKEIAQKFDMTEEAVRSVMSSMGIDLTKVCPDCGVEVTEKNKPATRSSRCKKCFYAYLKEKKTNSKIAH